MTGTQSSTDFCKTLNFYIPFFKQTRGAKIMCQVRK